MSAHKTPRTLKEWEAEWQAILDRDNANIQTIRETTPANASEPDLRELLAMIRESQEMYQDIFKTAWFLWVMGKLLTWPRWWRPGRRAEYAAVAKRLRVPVDSFVHRTAA